VGSSAQQPSRSAGKCQSQKSQPDHAASGRDIVVCPVSQAAGGSESALYWDKMMNASKECLILNGRAFLRLDAAALRASCEEDS
jgi:hypothetical protein